MLIGMFSHVFFGVSIFITSVFLVLLVLVQRGRGGGLVGALGGPGGQSALGTKAGDVFTRITIVVAAIWIFLCAASVRVLNPSSSNPLLGLDEYSEVSADRSGGAAAPAAGTGAGAPTTGAPTTGAPGTGTPGTGTPGTGTPGTGTPGTGTPAGEAAPGSSAAPESSTPDSSTPGGSTPVSSTPDSSTPGDSAPADAASPQPNQAPTDDGGAAAKQPE